MSSRERAHLSEQSLEAVSLIHELAIVHEETAVLFCQKGSISL